jgi:hypothetical protein
MSQLAHVKKVVEPDIFVTAEAVAKRYKVTSRAVLLWADRGLIPSLKIGTKTRRFEMAAVIAALEGGNRP